MLPGVSVVVRNEATNTARTATTNDSGIYRVPVLQPGSYEVEAKLAGFKTLVNFGVVLTIGEIRTVDLQLSLGAISEIVVVSDRRTLLDTEDSQLSSLVDHRRIRDLPLNGRNVYSLSPCSPEWFRPCPPSPAQKHPAPFSPPAPGFGAIISHWMGRPITTKV